MSLWFRESFNLDVIDAINVLLFSSDRSVAYLYIAYVLSVNWYQRFVWLVHSDADVCRVQG